MINKICDGLKLRLLFILFLVLGWGSPAFADGGALTPEAQKIYEGHHQAVVQVRVLSQGSGEKFSIGSGFYFSKDGLIATNYHVVSEVVNTPGSYTVEVIAYDGKKIPAKIINIDPVHDLAILRAEVVVERFLLLGHSFLQKGDKIFSFGNPHDLGLIIVDGLFNGLIDNARYRKIIFSGALNPGMSGGPAVGPDGRVVGVNVATSGNDISFIVPVEFLSQLSAELKTSARSKEPGWHKLIRKRIVLDQNKFFAKILRKKQWNKRTIGRLELPGDISGEIRCWGHGSENKNSWVDDTYLTCSVSDDVYLSRTMRTGYISFAYEWYRAKGDDTVRFYNLLEQYASRRDFAFKNAYPRDVANFQCDQFFTNIGGHKAKTEFCARRYLEYPGLFDIAVQITSTHLPLEGGVINFYGLGVTESQTRSFLSRFLREISWKE